MSTTHELIVQGVAVLVTVEERDGLFTGKVNGRPEIQATASTRAAVLRKIDNRMQYATDIAA